MYTAWNTLYEIHNQILGFLLHKCFWTTETLVVGDVGVPRGLNITDGSDCAVTSEKKKGGGRVIHSLYMLSWKKKWWPSIHTCHSQKIIQEIFEGMGGNQIPLPILWSSSLTTLLIIFIVIPARITYSGKSNIPHHNSKIKLKYPQTQKWQGSTTKLHHPVLDCLSLCKCPEWQHLLPGLNATRCPNRCKAISNYLPQEAAQRWTQTKK